MSDVQLHPAWREAVELFLAENFTPGTVITHAWFYQALGIKRPRPDTPHAEAQRLKLQFLDQFNPLRMSLLTEQQIDLASEPSVGYRVVPAGEQTKLAEKDGEHEIRKAVRKMGARIYHTNLEMLSAAERQENADAHARFSMLNQLLKHHRRLPDTKAKPPALPEPKTNT
jgi:hypothetical protein